MFSFLNEPNMDGNQQAFADDIPRDLYVKCRSGLI